MSEEKMYNMYVGYLSRCRDVYFLLFILVLGWGMLSTAHGQDQPQTTSDSEEPVDFRIRTDPPQIGIAVRIRSRSGSIERETKTDEQGIASFSRLPRGKYEVIIRQGDYRRTMPVHLAGPNFKQQRMLASPVQAQFSDSEIDGMGTLGSLNAWVENRYVLYSALFILGGIAVVLGYIVMGYMGRESEDDEIAERERSKEAGAFEKKRQIGAGGMATIWLAEDPEGRDVALKVMREGMLDDEELVHKFVQEGEALERINTTHPEAPVVHVYDYGYLSGERPFLSLEYLPDQSLEQVVKHKEALSTPQALPVMRQVAMALSAAHANGIYHRDVKPENVIIVGRSSSLQIKLIDFGVARHEYMPRETMEGSLLGSPPYMSPEQASSGDLGAASDIYSLGVLSYTLLSGQPPFLDNNPLRILEMHQEAKVPPLPDHVPRSVARLVYWMLEKSPDDRPDQMWEVVGRLDELIADSAGH